MADLTARWFNFNVGATYVADLTARWFQFILGATDVADLTARCFNSSWVLPTWRT